MADPGVRATSRWTHSAAKSAGRASSAHAWLEVARTYERLLTGGFYEPILPMLREPDKVGQIQRLIQREFKWDALDQPIPRRYGPV